MRARKIVFGFNNQKIIVNDYIICRGLLSKIRGLMFRRKNYSKPLLFVWESAKKRAIHSFFCRKFLAVWMFNDEIIKTQIVEPWEGYVVPKEKFNFLLEIPFITLEKLKILDDN